MTIAAYDAIADWYDATIRAGSLLHDLVFPALWEMSGEVAGRRICDLACGQGIVARQLALRGARVTGIDIADRLLEIARRDEAQEPLGIVYQHDDAQTLHTLGEATFDGVICNMALMDIPDVAATFCAVRRILRPGGWFVFSITHPCFQTSLSRWIAEEGNVGRAVRGYFTEQEWRSDNPEGVRGRVGARHRTLSTYINAVTTARLCVEALREPVATGHIAERLPGYCEVPALLMVRCGLRAAKDTT